MDIVDALRKEKAKLEQRLMAIQGAIIALNGSTKTASVHTRTSSPRSTNGRRTMSAAVRAKISKKAKERWARIKAQKGAGKKAK